jgi:hypothetical protein
VFTVDTVEPTVAITADDGLQGLVGQPLSFTFTATDASPFIQAGEFRFRITWGEGPPQNLDSLSPATVSHTYTTPGIKIVSVIVEDQFEVRSITPVTLRLNIVSAMQQGADVLIAGTTGNDRITLTRGALSTVFLVSMNNSLLGRFTVGAGGRVLISGRGGSDTVVVRGTATANVFRATATGLILDDTIIDAPDATSFLLNGNGGNDTLVGLLDADNTFRLAGMRSGNLNGRFRFSGIRNLTSGIGVDTFIVTNAARGFGIIDAGGGVNNDTLNFSVLARPFTVNLRTSTAPGISLFLNVDNLIGNNRTATLVSSGPEFIVDRLTNTGTVADIGFSRFNRRIGAPTTFV